jgi:hypothetical protein
VVLFSVFSIKWRNWIVQTGFRLVPPAHPAYSLSTLPPPLSTKNAQTFSIALWLSLSTLAFTPALTSFLHYLSSGVASVPPPSKTKRNYAASSNISTVPNGSTLPSAQTPSQLFSPGSMHHLLPTPTCAYPQNKRSIPRAPPKLESSAPATTLPTLSTSKCS